MEHLINKTFEIFNKEDLRTFVKDLAIRLKAGDVVILKGNLGAGKTTLVQILLSELGIEEPVTSPTYSIVNSYKTRRFALHHSDVYRVNDEDELYNIGFEDYFSDDAVVFIEWGDTITEYLDEIGVSGYQISIELMGEKRILKMTRI